LSNAEERYRLVIEGLEEGVLFRSADGAISGWNPSAQRILGSELERLGAGAVHEDGSPFPRDEQPDALALRSGLPSPRAVMGIPGAAGELIWISVRAHPLIRTDEIAPHGVVMSFVDITKQRRMLRGLLPICASCKKICHNIDDGLVEDPNNVNNLCTPCATAKEPRGGKGKSAAKRRK